MANMNFGVNILPKTNNTYSLGNSDYKWNIYANTINGTEVDELTLPSVTSEDNNKILKVSEGEWTVGTAPSSLDLGETSTTAYRGDRGKAAYDAAVVNPDSTPTESSTNLITSGGVYDALPDVMTGADSSIDGSVGLVPAPEAGDETKFLMGDGTWSDLPELIGADSVNNGVSGIVPAPLAGEEEYFLKGDGTWSAPDMIGSDGASDGSAGFVPAPLAADVNKFLCGAGTWEDPFVMTGAAPDSDGESGAVPAPVAGEEELFLRGDGTWDTPIMQEMTGATSSTDGESGAVPAPLTGEEDYFLKGDGTWSAVNASPMVGATDSTDGEGGTVPAPLTGYEDAFLRGDGTWAYPNTGMPFPSDMSSLANDGTYLYSIAVENGESSPEFIENSEMTGATSSTAGTGGLVPAPSAGDEDKFLAGDGTYKSGGLPMVILSYGSSTWAEFEAAYNNNVIVYCRASSNSNPASGSQTRMAFMAYVNNATTPTEVEFQYYRSMSSHSSTAMGDQVFVYKLTKTGGWSVTTRDASIKQIKADTGTALGVSWSSNVVTLTNTMTAANMPMSSSDATTVSSAISNNSQAIANLNTGLNSLQYLKYSVYRDDSNGTSYSFTTKASTGVGILVGFDEVWAFSYAPGSGGSIGAKQIARAMRNQGDRGFAFAYNDSTKVITVTTSSTVWGGIAVFYV